jgi:Reverse transcriptase (RNA-dependent DNA polymerase)
VVISANEVAQAIAHLKWHKRDGYKGLSTNHFKHAGPSICQHLAHLFNGMLRHGSVPDDFLQGTTIPIPKQRTSNATVSANYRGITLSSVFGRILDLIVLDRYSSVLQSDQLQFGFKAKHSTAMCTMVLREIINCYVSENSTVYCTFLDASKAFDKINYCRLFELLLRRRIPRTLLRLLLNIYTGQSVRVLWNGCLSSTFPVTNGVKQGGILSPILFCVYYDELLQELRRTNTGCHIGSWFVGVLAYADDLALLAPSASAMRKLLATCEQFSQRFSLSFNAAKSKCMCFAPSSTLYHARTLPQFAIHGGVIEFVDEWLHLGHTLTTDLSTDADVTRGRNALIGQINNFVCQFGSLDVVTKNQLFRAYCSSHYGSVLWDFNCSALEAYASAWRTGLRRIWGLPFNSHCTLVTLVSTTVPVFDILCQRFVNHMINCLTGPNALVSFVARYALQELGMASPVTRNLFRSSKHFCIASESLLSRRLTSLDLMRMWTRRVPSEDVAVANATLELLFAREGHFLLAGYMRRDVDSFLDCISTL